MQQPINGLYIYAYHHDDERMGWIPIEEFRLPVYTTPFNSEQRPLSPEFIEEIKSTLSSCGWEGDGRLEAMMLPPWLSELTGWFPVFHVKQSNNGTSWIACERRLTLEDLDSDLPYSIYRDGKREGRP